MKNEFNLEYHKKFKKEKEKFARRCPSIEKDFKLFKDALIASIIKNNYKVPVNTGKYSYIQGLSEKVKFPSFVAKKFYCAKMNKGAKSGFRITFIYDISTKTITFMEFYFKSKNKIENKKRIEDWFN